MIRLFLDANVLFAAAVSPSGGSARVLAECRRGRGVAFVSRLVLLEAERNLRLKFPPSTLARYRRLLQTVPLRVVSAPTAEAVRRYQPLINEKDAHVLAAAVASGAAYLVTLDRRHFLTASLRAAKLPLRLLTPGDLLQTVWSVSG